MTEDGTESAQRTRRRWRAWLLTTLLNGLLVFGLLQLLVRREVTGPLDRLHRSVRKMELGYWRDVTDPGGAWEIRWLGWRFRALGRELERTVEHQVAAQRRAMAIEHGASVDPEWSASPGPGPRITLVSPLVEEELSGLRSELEQLVTAPEGSHRAIELAQRAWERGAARAARLGDIQLRNALEDAALSHLDPGGYAEVCARIHAEESRLLERRQLGSTRLQQALHSRGISLSELQHRLKHPAGVWRKMQEKDLAFEQVHDLVALRVVVPTETDCYLVLGVVHDLFEPVVSRFKDYIASPKPSGYRAIHASVRAPDGGVFEVQIRSAAMHLFAETGPAAHTVYKARRRDQA